MGCGFTIPAPPRLLGAFAGNNTAEKREAEFRKDVTKRQRLKAIISFFYVAGQRARHGRRKFLRDDIKLQRRQEKGIAARRGSGGYIGAKINGIGTRRQPDGEGIGIVG